MAILALMLALWSCKDDLNKTGYDLLLPGDLISAHKVIMDKSTMSSYTVEDERLSTFKPSYNLLGTFVDPVMGITVADFAAQFKLLEVPSYKTTEEIDSTVLVIRYSSTFYGDTLVPLKINVYELTSGLEDTDTAQYYQDEDLKSMTNGQVVGSATHFPTRKRINKEMNISSNNDTTYTIDTIYTDLRIHLSKALQDKLVSASLNSLDTIEPNERFMRSFKGLYVESEPLAEGGAILKAAPEAIHLYTHKWNKKTVIVDNVPKTDSTLVAVDSRIDITKNSARVNRFDHGGYQTAIFAGRLGKDAAEQNPLLYLQSPGGLNSYKIELISYLAIYIYLISKQMVIYEQDINS